ncbi:MAG: hypothetical protein LUG52_08170 [Clostridia bacterium]|nr:hypothetical protein [Clostridia bacterium]
MENEYIAYEYKEVRAERKDAVMLTDCYECFGWELNGEFSEGLEKGKGDVVLRFKRARGIVNKAELTRLQRNFEACVDEIVRLEKSKKTMPRLLAWTIALVGTAFMAGSTFAITAAEPKVLLCILLAIPGFLGWILPYFAYKKGLDKETLKVNSLIEQKYDEIYELCEKGNKLR